MGLLVLVGCLGVGNRPGLLANSAGRPPAGIAHPEVPAVFARRPFAPLSVQEPQRINLPRRPRPAAARRPAGARRPAQTCMVTSTASSGAGTLRACLQNQAAGDTILFDPAVFPPGNPQTILLADFELPYLTADNLTLDASDAGVIVDGRNLPLQNGFEPSGFVIQADGVTIRGLQIVNFGWGIYVWLGAENATIGGDRALGNGPLGRGNRLGGNSIAGILVENADGLGTADTTIRGNLIGTDLSGSGADANETGILVGAAVSGTTIGGEHSAGRCDRDCNLISGNATAGVWLQDPGTTGSLIQGNFVGTDLSGSAANGNGQWGIFIGFGASGNVVGGARSAGQCDQACNLIGGNPAGVQIQSSLGATAADNTVQGNFVGTDASGQSALPNAIAGIRVNAGSQNTQIGGANAGEGNLISGNTNEGIRLEGAETAGTRVYGNYIGTDIAGEAALPNQNGLLILDSRNNEIGGETSLSGNLISGNNQDGLQLLGAQNLIQNNKIGTNAAGTAPLPNQIGLLMEAATGNTVRQNLVSGNAGEGVQLQFENSANVLAGNFVGTDAAGTQALPNGANGIVLVNGPSQNAIGGSTAGAGNLIGGNAGSGLVVVSANTQQNEILGNKIGTDVTGSRALPNQNGGISVVLAQDTLIGGTHAPGVCTGPCNLISGNALSGIGISGQFSAGPDAPAGRAPAATTAQNTRVLGNFIGTDLAGTNAVPNDSGIGLQLQATGNLIGGESAGAGNVISGNSLRGVEIRDQATSANQVAGNLIGTAADGASPLPNAEDGILFVDAGNNTIGPQNVIAYNENVGVNVGRVEAVGNTITQNRIFFNAHGQIAFYDVPVAIAPAPVLTAWDGATVRGSSCAGCRVELFANVTAAPAGRDYLATTVADGAGNFALAVGPGYAYLTATATAADGSTSAFTPGFLVGDVTHLPLIVR